MTPARNLSGTNKVFRDGSRWRAGSREGKSLSPACRRVVLVVEDQALIRMGAVDMVKSAGFEAVEAGNADEAIAILEAQPDIHLVFTDISMPGSMDGLRLANYIRNRWPPILLILASGRVSIDDETLPVGARFFSKPYSEAVVVETMASMFDLLDAA
jgi:CheY-like chemotaxis protein